MIQVRITTKGKSKITEIVALLLHENLITGVSVSETMSSFKDNDNKIITIPTSLLVGRTKSSLFSTIESLLLDRFGADIPAIYGIPIINIDTKHLSKLKTTLKDE